MAVAVGGRWCLEGVEGGEGEGARARGAVGEGVIAQARPGGPGAGLGWVSGVGSAVGGRRWVSVVRSTVVW